MEIEKVSPLKSFSSKRNSSLLLSPSDFLANSTYNRARLHNELTPIKHAVTSSQLLSRAIQFQGPVKQNLRFEKREGGTAQGRGRTEDEDDWDSDEDAFYEKSQYLLDLSQSSVQQFLKETNFAFYDRPDERSVLNLNLTQVVDQNSSSGDRIVIANPQQGSVLQYYQCRQCDKYFEKACALGGHISRSHKSAKDL